MSLIVIVTSILTLSLRVQLTNLREHTATPSTIKPNARNQQSRIHPFIASPGIALDGALEKPVAEMRPLLQSVQPNGHRGCLHSMIQRLHVSKDEPREDLDIPRNAE